jgi:hypothetical protein
VPSTTSYGHLTNSSSQHYGETTGWEFGTGIGYNKGNGVIVNSIELVTLSGRTLLGLDPTISTSYSNDGINWSEEKFIKSGKQGETNKRLMWVRQGRFNNWRVQKFKGTSDSFMSFSLLDANLEPLHV